MAISLFDAPTPHAPLGRSATRVLRVAGVMGDIAWRSALARGDGPRALALRHQRAAIATAEAHAMTVSVRGRLPSEPSLLVANHRSYLDPIAIGTLAPLLAIAKSDVERWPLVGARLREMGVLFVKRDDPSSGARVLRRVLAALRSGANVLNFPEGTTSDQHRPLPFFRGSFGTAMRAGAPIVPLRIDYDDPDIAWTGDATFVPHYLGVVRRASIGVRVRIGAPLDVDGASDPARVAERARDAIFELGR